MATTARDFDAVAKIIDSKWTANLGDESEQLLVDTACHLADYFQSQNARFDRERFLKACGLSEETVGELV